MTAVDAFYARLREAVRDRGMASLSSIADLAATDRDLHVKGPCVAAMACWGDAGFQRMIENALRTQTSKDTSATLKTLALIAAGRPLTAQTTFIVDHSFLDEVNRAVSALDQASLAKQRLTEFVMTLPDDDLMIPLGVVFTQIGLEGTEPSSKILSALTSKWIGFGPRELADFERLLKQQADNEPALHAFLERYPQMLDPMAVQVWSKPDFHGFKEPDFLIRRSDDTYLVVEIENAAKKLMTQADQPSAWATQAVKQVNDYRSFIADRPLEARQHFPGIRDPDALVVIGLEADLEPSQSEALRRENASRNKVRIVGFDWVLNRSRTVLSNIAASKVHVVRNHRVV